MLARYRKDVPLCIFSFLLLLGFPVKSHLYGQYAVNGSASNLGSDCFRLTTEGNFQGGSVWYLDRVNISESFDLLFKVNLGCKDSDGADGIAFVLQQVSTQVGTAGGGLGYQGISPSIAIELDTWYNDNIFDPTYDHIALMRNGNVNHTNPNNLAGPVPMSATSFNVEDCQYHDFRVTWNADSNILRAYFDCELRLTYTGDIIQTTFGNNPNVFWGFTGATGGFNNTHEFCLDFISFFESMEDTAICPGGIAQLDAGEGDTYSWRPTTGLSNPSIRNPIVSPTTTTTYIVDVLDGCTLRSDTVTVEVKTSFPSVLPQEVFLCNGQTVTLEADAGWDLATYEWSDGTLGPINIVSTPGTYSVTVFTPCDTFTESVEVRPQSVPGLRTTDITCADSVDGSASVSINSLPPYNYRWFDGAGSVILNTTSFQRTSQVNNLAAGNYEVRIVDGAGCDTTLFFTIQAPPPLQLSIVDETDITCGGEATGIIQVSSSGGSGSFQYARDGGTYQPAPLFNGLIAGSYVIVARDANGCTDTVETNLVEPPLLTAQVLATKDALCFGDSSGQVQLAGDGGVGGYTFGLDQGSVVNNSLLSGLSAGTYSGFVQDAAGCQASVGFTIRQPTPLRLTSNTLADVSCNGEATGIVSVQATGGSPGYRFALSNGPLGTDTVFANLPAGTFPVQVQDDSGCVIVRNVTVSEPAPLVLTTANRRDVACFGDSTGWVRLAGTGGVGAYAYAELGDTFKIDNGFRGYPIGDVDFVVRDGNSCLDTLTVSFAQPPLLTLAVSERQDVDCFGNNTGRLIVDAAGGVAPYTYAINTSAYQPAPVFDSLFAGFYNLRVQDDNGCVSQVDTIITTPTGLAIGIDEQINVDCHGDSTGQLTFQAQGGTAPYRYTYDNLTFFPLTQALTNLPASADTLFAYDANGCLVPIPYFISQPDPLGLTVTFARDLRCFGDNSGEISLAGSQGTTPYAYRLNGGPTQADSTFLNLPAGAFQAEVIDDSGCVTLLDTILIEPPLLAPSFDSVRMVDCWQNQTGYLSVAVAGGSAPFVYAFEQDSFLTDFVFDGLGAGTYQVIVRDDSSCTDTIRQTITQPDSLTLSVVDLVDVGCFGDSSGQVDLIANGGTLPYRFGLNLVQLQDDPVINGLPVGTYTFFVVDSQACQATIPVQITQPDPLVLSLVNRTAVSCFGLADGLLEVESAGGFGPPQYFLNGDSLGPNPVFSPLPPDVYQVRVQDANGCIESLDSLLITQPDSLVVTLSTQDVSCKSGANGSIMAEITGGNGMNEILWSPTGLPTEPNVFDLPAGAYAVLISDSLGCSDTSSAVIAEPDTLILSLVEVIDAFCSFDNGAAEIVTSGGTLPYQLDWIDLAGFDQARAEDLLSGNYVVFVEDALGCEDSISFFVGDTPPATPFFEPIPLGPRILLSQNPVPFLNLSEGAVRYTWEFGDGMTSEETEPIHEFPDIGTYDVTLTAFNAFEVCPITYTYTIELIPDGQLFFPNAFSPNGDLVNDVFYLKGEGVVELETIIFDRWGRKVAVLQSLDQGWDGYLPNGSPAPEGVYAFATRALFNSGDRMDRAGSITLFR